MLILRVFILNVYYVRMLFIIILISIILFFYWKKQFEANYNLIITTCGRFYIY